MAEKSFYPELGDNLPSVRLYHGLVPIGAAGAVGTVDIPNAAFAVVKNAAAGRYNCTLHRAFGRLLNVLVSLEGPSSASFGNTNANLVDVRNMNAAAGTFDVQLLLASTGVDTDAASGYNVRITVVVSDWKGF